MRFRRSKGSDESQKAIEDAEKHVQEVQSRAPEVKKVVTELRELRNRNHFAEQIASIMVRDMRRGL